MLGRHSCPAFWNQKNFMPGVYDATYYNFQVPSLAYKTNLHVCFMTEMRIPTLEGLIGRFGRNLVWRAWNWRRPVFTRLTARCQQHLNLAVVLIYELGGGKLLPPQEAVECLRLLLRLPEPTRPTLSGDRIHWQRSLVMSLRKILNHETEILKFAAPIIHSRQSPSSITTTEFFVQQTSRKIQIL
jgi:hypothetical protein